MVAAPFQSRAQYLKKYNLALAFLHLGSLLGIHLLSTSKWPVYIILESSKWSPIDTNSTQSCADTPCKIEPVYRSLTKVYVETLVILFHIPAFLSHLYAGVFHDQAYRYIDDVERPRVPHRWLEYSISASIMMVCILILTGATDFWILLLSFTMCAAVQFMGYLGEYYPDRWIFFFIGCFLMIPPWAAAIKTFLDSLDLAETKVPSFVKYIIWSLFAAYSCFAFVALGQKKGYWDAIGAEKGYMILSLIAKTGLAWQIFYGALGREERSLVAYNPG